jgi:hypothetical protein
MEQLMEHYGALMEHYGALMEHCGALRSTVGALEQQWSTDGALGAAMEH